MIGKHHLEELITTEEAVRLCLEAGTADSIVRAKRIFNATIDAATKYGYREEFAESCALSAIYDAGRIQGIREERARKKARNIETA